MRFSRIRLENWRNFSEVDVPLQNRVFLVGANASGKSNFLDVFRFLHDLVIPGGGFQEAINKRGGVSIIRNLAARGTRTDVSIEVELSEDDRTLWRYRIAFKQDYHNKYPVLKEEKIWRDGDLILDRPLNTDREDEARLTQTYLEQTFANRDFRDVTAFFRSINYSHIVPQLVRDPERSTGRMADPYGGDFLEQMADVKPRIREGRLNRIRAALELVVPQFSGLELSQDDRGIWHLRGKYKHWRPQGAWQTEAQFSDGTLRLIGLLWALQDVRGALLLEEPELSLHPGAVRRIPQMINKVQRGQKPPRQVLISTHSSELLSDEGIAPDEVLLLKPSSEGTTIYLSAEDTEIVNELNSGLTIAEVVLNRTEPTDTQQLMLWDV